MDDARVATDAPVSTDLMTDISVNENYLKAVLTDGAAAPQSISTKNVTANGDLVVTGTSLLGGMVTVTTGGMDITGDVDIDGSLDVTGDLTVGGTFDIADIALLLSAL